jgi:hypothetical protein
MDGMAYSYIPEWGNETRTGSMPYRFFSLIPFQREEHRENRCKKKGEKE